MLYQPATVFFISKNRARDTAGKKTRVRRRRSFPCRMKLKRNVASNTESSRILETRVKSFFLFFFSFFFFFELGSKRTINFDGEWTCLKLYRSRRILVQGCLRRSGGR